MKHLKSFNKPILERGGFSNSRSNSELKNKIKELFKYYSDNDGISGGHEVIDESDYKELIDDILVAVSSTIDSIKKKI